MRRRWRAQALVLAYGCAHFSRPQSRHSEGSFRNGCSRLTAITSMRSRPLDKSVGYAGQCGSCGVMLVVRNPSGREIGEHVAFFALDIGGTQGL